MTPYQVFWEPTIWKKLHRLRRGHASPADIDDSYARIRQKLGTDPHGHGTPLSEGLWKLADDPLQVFYSINTPLMRVTISNVGVIS